MSPLALNLQRNTSRQADENTARRWYYTINGGRMTNKRDVTLTLTLDRAVWLAIYQMLLSKEHYWTEAVSQANLQPLTRAIYRKARERWGGAREHMEASLHAV